MSLVVSEVEFAVPTVLISVRVNDSAPSLGTQYRGGWVRGRESKMESVKSTNRNTARSAKTIFLPFWFNFKFHFPYPPYFHRFFFFFFFLQSLFFFTHLNLVWCWEGLSWSPAGRELVDKEASATAGTWDVWKEYRMHVLSVHKHTHTHSYIWRNAFIMSQFQL